MVVNLGHHGGLSMGAVPGSRFFFVLLVIFLVFALFLVLAVCFFFVALVGRFFRHVLAIFLRLAILGRRVLDSAAATVQALEVLVQGLGKGSRLFSFGLLLGRLARFR